MDEAIQKTVTRGYDFHLRFTPARQQLMPDPELIANAPDDEVNGIFERARLGVERGHRG